MKTKEEVIKEAWGNISDKINKDGWLYFGYACNGWDDVQDWLDSNKLNSDRNYYDMKYDQCDNGDLIYVEIRPKSLKGIENNNGWIKIESEEDLPKIGEYDMSSFTLYYFTTNGLYKATDYINWCVHVVDIKITHYRLEPIFKPKKPLY